MELWAHRGGGIGPLENTLEGFRTAIKHYFTAVELDLMITADGHLVVHHDKCIGQLVQHQQDYLPSHFRALSELTLMQFSCMSDKRSKVLLFIQILSFLLKYEIQVNVELKAHSPSVAARIGQRLSKMLSCLPEQQLDQIKRLWVFSSFNHSALLPLAKENYTIALLFEKLHYNWLDKADLFGAKAIHLHWSGLSETVIHEIKGTGRKIRVFTINQTDQYQHCKNLGVDGIFTDRITTYKNLFN